MVIPRLPWIPTAAPEFSAWAGSSPRSLLRTKGEDLGMITYLWSAKSDTGLSLQVQSVSHWPIYTADKMQVDLLSQDNIWKHRHHSKGSKPWSRVAAAYLELRRSTTSPHHCDYHMTTTHQISFQSPPLCQSMFPVPIQSRKIAPITRPGYIECINQYRSDFQAPGWSQIFEPDPAKSCGQEINKYIQTRQDTALGLQPATHQQQKPRWLKQEMPILAAKFGGDTVTRVKCPSSLSEASPAA